MYVGIDPGFSGAWGIIDHHGNYISCGDMIHDGRYIDTRMVHAEMSQAIDHQDSEFVIEFVHAMPQQGVSSTFKFGVAYGAAISILQRFKSTFHAVPPRVWKRAMELDNDKDKSLALARELWPNAPLARKKDNGRAEALLMAEWLRRENV
jgi:Holliday junction resolvasome RuvABC endonuclease subunit